MTPDISALLERIKKLEARNKRVLGSGDRLYAFDIDYFPAQKTLDR